MHSRIVLIISLIVGMIVFAAIVAAYSGAYPYQQAVQHHNTNNFNSFLSFLARIEVILESHEKLLILLATIAVAGFTAALYGATSGLYRVTAQQAEATPKRHIKINEWSVRHRAKKRMFEGPWRLVVTNFGRTTAFSTRIEWGLCPMADFPEGTAMKSLLETDTFREWRSQYLKEPVSVENIFAPSTTPLHIRHVEIANRDEFVGWIFFGRLTYKDVFKETHHAAFAYLLHEEHSDAFGSYLSSEHD